MKNYFLGIGIDRYKDGYFHSLKCAVWDVEKIEELLVEYYLFDACNSTLLLNDIATKEFIVKQVAQYHQLTGKFNLVIYFAGHGEIIGEEGYIIPQDAEKNEVETYISQKELLKQLEKIENCHHLLLLWDSCFSGSLFDVSTRQGPTDEQTISYPSRWAITSGSKWEKVLDGNRSKHSPFADAIKRTLHIQLDMITASFLAKEVQSFMVRNNHNPPLLSPLLMKGHEWGDFALELNSRYVVKSISTNILLPAVADPIVFFGRVEELHEIRQRLSRLSKGGHILLLHSEGGLGKTSLASKYWHNYKRAYKNMAWLNCQNGIYGDALPRLAMALGIDLNFHSEYLPVLKRRLAAMRDGFLLVLDNADDPTEIQKFQLEFGNLNLQALVTSRCKNILVEKTQEMPLGSLPLHLARKLFREYYSRESGEIFENLLDSFLEAIGSHTLMIEVFAKNLNEASTNPTAPLTMETFIRKLEDSGLYLEDNSFIIRTHYTGNVEKSAPTTDDILNILYDFSKLWEGERHVLLNLALLPAESYTLEFLTDLFQPTDPEKYNRTTGILFQKGWIGGSGRDFRISPVVQKLVIKRNKETLWHDCNDLINNVSKKLENDILLSNYLPVQKMLAIGKHIECNIEITDDPLSIYFFYNLFHAVRKLSSGKEWLLYAQKLITKIIDVNQENCEMGSNTFQTKIVEQAMVLKDLGGTVNLERSEKLLKDVIDFYETNPKNDSIPFNSRIESYVTTISNLGMVLAAKGNSGNLLEAKSLLEKVCKLLSNHEIALECKIVTLSNYATLLVDLGGYENLTKAKEIYDELIVHCKKEYGESSIKTAKRQNNLTVVLIGLGGNENLEIAKVNTKNALNTYKTNLGLEHELTLTGSNYYALLLQELGGDKNMSEAEEISEEVLRLGEKSLGKEAEKVIYWRNNLAVLLQNQGDQKKFNRALELLKLNVEICLSEFGHNHYNYHNSCVNYSKALLESGIYTNYISAKELLDQCVAFFEDNYGESNPKTSSCKSILVFALRTLSGRKNLIEAKNIHGSILSYDQKQFPPNHPTMIMRKYNHADILVDMEDYDDLILAKKLLEEALESSKLTHGGNHPITYRIEDLINHTIMKTEFFGFNLYD